MKPKVAVHKFSSCDGCQLAFLNLGEALLTLAQRVDIVHFAEAGMLDEEARVAVSFVEGSVSTEADLERIRQVRDNSDFLVTIGACATAGGIQALRNLNNGAEWVGDIYATPSHIDSLDQVTPIRAHVKVDLELWGCPVSGRQLLAALRSLLFGVAPPLDSDKVCMTCKREQTVCVMVTRGEPCMGPVTRSGCGALCPRFGRDCYGCYGPAESANTGSLANRLQGLGLVPAAVANRFWAITNQAEPFLAEGGRWQSDND